MKNNFKVAGRRQSSAPPVYIAMPRLKTWKEFVAPLILVVSLLALYLHTLAPGLTWANAGSDGGDLIAAAATGGIAHPTGYPLYLLLARLFQFLPVGSLAFRTNLMSALAVAMAAALVYDLVMHTIPLPEKGHAWPAGMAAGYAFGLAPLIWSQAVITEVYALQVMLTALILNLYTRANPSSGAARNRLDCWRGFVLSLAVCNQIIAILFVPVALVLGWSLARQDAKIGFRDLKFDGASFARQAIFLALGLSLYLIIPLRAIANPPVNWGNAITLQRFWWLVSGQLYQSYYLQIDRAGFGERMQSCAALLLRQFGLLGVVLGFIGLIIFGSRNRLYILSGWVALVSAVFAIFYGSHDSYVYLMPMLLCFSIWIGLGIAGLVRQLSLLRSALPKFTEKFGFVRTSAPAWQGGTKNGMIQFFCRGQILGLAMSLILIGYFVSRSVIHMNEVDASKDQRAESFGREVLTTVPQNAVLLAEGDGAVFALWYFHFALGERPDVAVLAADLLHFDWYQENLHAVYPRLVIPGPFPFPETISSANPERAVCYVQYSDKVEMDCSE